MEAFTLFGYIELNLHTKDASNRNNVIIFVPTKGVTLTCALLNPFLNCNLS